MLALSLLAAPLVAAATDAPVAVIGAETISGDDYLAYLRGYIRSKLYHGGSPERLRELADEALDSLVTDRLLAQEAQRRGIEGDSEQVAARMASIRERYSSDPDWPEIEAQLPEIEREILIDTRIDALKGEVSEVAPPTEAELRDFHTARPDLFTQPLSWDFDLILIGVPPSALAAEREEAEGEAATVYAELLGGRSFAELASAHSTHETAALGGHLGRVHRGQLPDAAQAVIEKLSPGEASEPIRLLEGYAILRLNDRTEARLQPFEAVRDRAEGLYRRDRAAAQWSEFLASLRARTHVETFDVSGHVRKLLAGQ